MEWILVVLFGGLSLLLLAGRGSFLIAGYNTSSANQKARYDEKKLCRVVGCGLSVMTVFIAIGAVFGERLPQWYVAASPFLVVADVVVMIVLCNTICRKKLSLEEEAALKEGTPEQKKREKMIVRISLLFTVAVFAVVGVFLFTGEVETRVTDGKIYIRGSYWPDYEIALSDIHDMELRGDFRTGSRTSGLGSFRLEEGHFQNKELGNYILYAYVKCPSHIVMETAGGTLVLNGRTEEETKALYDELRKEWMAVTPE